MQEIAVIVTCHERYLQWLPEALASIDRQCPTPAERIVAFDRCSAPANLDGRWRCVEGDWGHPSGGRNAGVAATTAPWLIFWDADNVMPVGYMAAALRAATDAPLDVGIIYPDIQYCDVRMTPQRLWQTPPWDYWTMRAENCIDTASLWRRDAIEIVGGWSEGDGPFEDYVLALNITAAGWRATKLPGPPIYMRVHPDARLQRSAGEGGLLTDLWHARSLAIVSLLAGRVEVFDRWVNFLRHAELPRKTALYVVENSGSPAFTRRAFEACQQLAGERPLAHVSFATQGGLYQPAPADGYFVKARHLQVGRLYASVLPRIGEDLVLTLEDDVEPPSDAVRRLGEEIGYPTRANIGAVAAAYTLPQSPQHICAGLGPEGWGQSVSWEQLPDEPFDVACVGGGCTMWANWTLRECPVHLWWDLGLGWDGVLCTFARRKGYRILLHGGVRCHHHLHGRLDCA